MRARLRRVSPPFRRILWYLRQFGQVVDRRFFAAVIPFVLIMAMTAAVIVTVVEKPVNLESLAASFNWALLTAVGRPPPGYIASPMGWVVFWVLVIFGVTLIGTVTAAIVGIVVSFLLKEGQGMGVSGFRDHVVVCGWNATARDLIRELRQDDHRLRLALIHTADRNPAGEGVYYVRGDASEAGDLRRAGVEEAAAAVVFPLEDTPDADMRSILITLTIRSMAPSCRIVAEVNDGRLADHFRRAGANELMVTSRIAARLLARSAIYPGLTDLVADLVSSGGSELYAVRIPSDMLGLSYEEAIYRLRLEHQATLVAVRRDGQVLFTAPRDFELGAKDVAIVIADRLGRLVPADGSDGRRSSAAEPSAGAREPLVATRPIDAPTTSQNS